MSKTNCSPCGLGAKEQEIILERFSRRDKSAPLYDFCHSLAMELDISPKAVRRFVRGCHASGSNGVRKKPGLVCCRGSSQRTH